mmetsp:Transcript_25323/g.38398  ORF Transcript_25323/g.38398 Transcript_25323/m.38398 type:complete len:171 (+) Transcript_25323:1333-1845(+)
MVREWLKNAGEEAEDDYALNFYTAMKETTKGQKYELPEYSKDNMVDLISTIVFTVTAYHELIGHVPDYTDFSNKAGLRIPRNGDMKAVDIQAFILMSLISSSTSLPAPQLMADFKNYIGVGGAPTWERDVWMKFQAEQKLQKEKVEKDAEKRAVEWKYFDPSRFECSVSV